MQSNCLKMILALILVILFSVGCTNGKISATDAEVASASADNSNSSLDVTDPSSPTPNPAPSPSPAPTPAPSPRPAPAPAPSPVPAPAPAPSPLPSPAPSPSPSPAMNGPGPSAKLHANNPYYTCTTNRYVATAANGGSDSNNGTSATNQGGGVGPWLTIQNAISRLPSPAPGWCINLGAGVYPINSTILFNKGGNAASKTGFTVLRSSQLLGAKLQAGTGASNVIQISVPYIIIDGIEIDGMRRPNLDHAISSCLNGFNYNGIHHISIFNSYIHDAGGGGIATCWAEYYWMIHNRLDKNSYLSWHSGITTYQPMMIPGYTPTTYDNQWAPYRNVYAFNRFNGNFTDPQASLHTDGNGLIYDDTQHSQYPPNTLYTPKALIMGNVSWGNGGAGFQIGPTSANVDVFNNTAYNNYLDTVNSGTWRGEISVAFGKGVTVKNNIGFAIRGAGILSNNSPFLAGNPVDATNVWLKNIAFGANPVMYSPATFSSSTNKVDTNPLFANPNGSNFALCTGVGVPHPSCAGPSPALGYGDVVPYWPQQNAGSVDVGACPRGLTQCP